MQNLTIRLKLVAGSIADHRFVRAVAVRNSHQVKVEALDIAQFSLANGIITVDSSIGVKVAHNFIHDSFSNSTIRRGQITGITVDDNRIQGRHSSDILIERNVIRRLTVGDHFRAKFGFETDGRGASASAGKQHQC